MEAKYRRPSKTHCIEKCSELRMALRTVGNELALLTPSENDTHNRRMNSILGAGVINDLREAEAKVLEAMRKVRSIRRHGNFCR
jgi:hypothetical protein